MKIKNRLTEIKTRGEPTLQEKIIKDDDGIGTHLVNKKIKEKYKYYVCDYCGQEIKIKSKWDEREGAKITLSSTITRKGDITVALHNKCLKPTLKEFEEE